MAKPKKSFVQNVVIGKILSLASLTFARLSITRLLQLRTLTAMQSLGQAPVTWVSEVRVKAHLSQLKWQLKLQLKQQWNMA